MTRVLAVLVAVLLLGACNGGSDDGASSASEERALLETRDRVRTELRSVVADLAAGLEGAALQPGQLRVVQQRPRRPDRLPLRHQRPDRCAAGRRRG